MAGEWPIVSLREAGVSLIDCEHRTPPPAKHGYPYVAIPQVKDGRINLNDVRYITREHFDEWTRKADPEPFDIVLSRRCNPGETGFVAEGLKFALGQNLVLLRSDGTKIFKPFLRWLVRGPQWWDQVSMYINVGAVFDSLKCVDIPGFRLPLPALPEQRAIAHILGTLDDKIELNRRMNQTLEAMARALFKSWFVDFDPVRAKMEGRDPGLPQHLADLFPDRLVDSELGQIPEGWETATLGDHVDNFDSKRVPVSGAERAKRQGPFPYHGAAGVMDHIDNYLFDGIYLLIGEDGSVIHESGLAITQYVWGKFWVNNHAHVLQGKGPVSTEQVYLYFHFEPVAPYVTGAVQPKLSQGRMNNMPFLFPGAAICKGFLKVISPWFARRRACSVEGKTLATLRDTLLTKFISGDLRVKDAETFLERVL